MIFWIDEAEFIEVSHKSNKYFKDHMKPVIQILNENVHKAFNLPKEEHNEKNSSVIKLNRKFHVLCSPRYILANVCNDISNSNIVSRLKCIYDFIYDFETMRYKDHYYILIRMKYINIYNERIIYD